MSHDQSITPEDLRQWIRYDPETAELVWKVGRGTTLAPGTKVFQSTTPDGYLEVRIKKGGKRKRLYAHRVAWAIHYGRWPAKYLDHRNGDRADNRIANLREATNQENQQNAKKCANNTSGVTGVHWDTGKKKWAAQIGSPRHGTHRRRRFRTFEEAVACRKAFEVEDGYSPIHGEDPVVRWLLG